MIYFVKDKIEKPLWRPMNYFKSFFRGKFDQYDYLSYQIYFDIILFRHVLQ